MASDRICTAQNAFNDLSPKIGQCGPRFALQDLPNLVQIVFATGSNCEHQNASHKGDVAHAPASLAVSSPLRYSVSRIGVWSGATAAQAFLFNTTRSRRHMP